MVSCIFQDNCPSGMVQFQTNIIIVFHLCVYVCVSVCVSVCLWITQNLQFLMQHFNFPSFIILYVSFQCHAIHRKVFNKRFAFKQNLSKTYSQLYIHRNFNLKIMFNSVFSSENMHFNSSIYLHVLINNQILRDFLGYSPTWQYSSWPRGAISWDPVSLKNLHP